MSLGLARAAAAGFGAAVPALAILGMVVDINVGLRRRGDRGGRRVTGEAECDHERRQQPANEIAELRRSDAADHGGSAYSVGRPDGLELGWINQPP